MTTTVITLKNPRGDLFLVVQANGGSLAVQAMAGGAWVTTDTITTDGSSRLDAGRIPRQFVPSGGLIYSIYNSDGFEIFAEATT